MKKVIFILILTQLLFVYSAKSQLSLRLGGNYATIFNQDRIPNQRAIATSTFGMLMKFPVKDSSRHHIKIGLLKVTSGYKQFFEEETYEQRFHYAALPVYYNLQLYPNFSLDFGVQLRIMTRPLFKRDNNIDNYRKADLATVFGLNFLDEKRLSIYVNASYGLIPMLRYEEIDAVGNFGDTFNDLHAFLISAGLNFRLSKYD